MMKKHTAAVRKSTRTIKKTQRILESVDSSQDDFMDSPPKKSRTSSKPRQRKKDFCKNGEPFICNMCGSPYINTSSLAARHKIEKYPIDREINGNMVQICVKCSTALNTLENKGPSTEEREKFEGEGKQFANQWAEILQEPEANRLYCSLYQTSKCGCIQNYVHGTLSSLRRRKTSQTFSESDQCDMPESGPSNTDNLPSQESSSSDKMKFLISLLKESKAKKKAQKINKQVSEEERSSLKKALDMFILSTRTKLKTLGICERGCQKVLCYSNNFLHKKPSSSEPRLQKTKGSLNINGRLFDIKDLHRKQCCEKICCEKIGKDLNKLKAWRGQAQLSQKDMWKVITEMLGTKGTHSNTGCCLKFIKMVTGCCSSTIQKVYYNFLLCKGDIKKPDHGMKSHWRKQREEIKSSTLASPSVTLISNAQNPLMKPDMIQSAADEAISSSSSNMTGMISRNHTVPTSLASSLPSDQGSRSQGDELLMEATTLKSCLDNEQKLKNKIPLLCNNLESLESNMELIKLLSGLVEIQKHKKTQQDPQVGSSCKLLGNESQLQMAIGQMYIHSKTPQPVPLESGYTVVQSSSVKKTDTVTVVSSPSSSLMTLPSPTTQNMGSSSLTPQARSLKLGQPQLAATPVSSLRQSDISALGYQAQQSSAMQTIQVLNSANLLPLLPNTSPLICIPPGILVNESQPVPNFLLPTAGHQTLVKTPSVVPMSLSSQSILIPSANIATSCSLSNQQPSSESLLVTVPMLRTKSESQVCGAITSSQTTTTLPQHATDFKQYCQPAVASTVNLSSQSQSKSSVQSSQPTPVTISSSAHSVIPTFLTNSFVTEQRIPSKLNSLDSSSSMNGSSVLPSSCSSSVFDALADSPMKTSTQPGAKGSLLCEMLQGSSSRPCPTSSSTTLHLQHGATLSNTEAHQTIVTNFNNHSRISHYGQLTSLSSGLLANTPDTSHEDVHSSAVKNGKLKRPGDPRQVGIVNPYISTSLKADSLSYQAGGDHHHDQLMPTVEASSLVRGSDQTSHSNLVIVQQLVPNDTSSIDQPQVNVVSLQSIQGSLSQGSSALPSDGPVNALHSLVTSTFGQFTSNSSYLLPQTSSADSLLHPHSEMQTLRSSNNESQELAQNNAISPSFYGGANVSQVHQSLAPEPNKSLSPPAALALQGTPQIYSSFLCPLTNQLKLVPLIITSANSVPNIESSHQMNDHSSNQMNVQNQTDLCNRAMNQTTFPIRATQPSVGIQLQSSSVIQQGRHSKTNLSGSAMNQTSFIQPVVPAMLQDSQKLNIFTPDSSALDHNIHLILSQGDLSEGHLSDAGRGRTIFLTANRSKVLSLTTPEFSGQEGQSLCASTEISQVSTPSSAHIAGLGQQPVRYDTSGQDQIYVSFSMPMQQQNLSLSSVATLQHNEVVLTNALAPTRQEQRTLNTSLALLKQAQRPIATSLAPSGLEQRNVTTSVAPSGIKQKTLANSLAPPDLKKIDSAGQIMGLKTVFLQGQKSEMNTPTSEIMVASMSGIHQPFQSLSELMKPFTIGSLDDGSHHAQTLTHQGTLYHVPPPPVSPNTSVQSDFNKSAAQISSNTISTCPSDRLILPKPNVQATSSQQKCTLYFVPNQPNYPTYQIAVSPGVNIDSQAEMISDAFQSVLDRTRSLQSSNQLVQTQNTGQPPPTLQPLRSQADAVESKMPKSQDDIVMSSNSSSRIPLIPGPTLQKDVSQLALLLQQPGKNCQLSQPSSQTANFNVLTAQNQLEPNQGKNYKMATADNLAAAELSHFMPDNLIDPSSKDQVVHTPFANTSAQQISNSKHIISKQYALMPPIDSQEEVMFLRSKEVIDLTDESPPQTPLKQEYQDNQQAVSSNQQFFPNKVNINLKDKKLNANTVPPISYTNQMSQDSTHILSQELSNIPFVILTDQNSSSLASEGALMIQDKQVYLNIHSQKSGCSQLSKTKNQPDRVADQTSKVFTQSLSSGSSVCPLTLASVLSIGGKAFPAKSRLTQVENRMGLPKIPVSNALARTSGNLALPMMGTRPKLSSDVVFTRATNTPTDAVGPPNVTVMSPSRLGARLRLGTSGGLMISQTSMAPSVIMPISPSTSDSTAMSNVSATLVSISPNPTPQSDPKQSSNRNSHVATTTSVKNIDSPTVQPSTSASQVSKPRKKPNTVMQLLKAKESANQKASLEATAGVKPFDTSLLLTGNLISSPLLLSPSTASVQLPVVSIDQCSASTSVSLNSTNIQSEIVPDTGHRVSQPVLLTENFLGVIADDSLGFNSDSSFVLKALSTPITKANSIGPNPQSAQLRSSVLQLNVTETSSLPKLLNFCQPPKTTGVKTQTPIMEPKLKLVGSSSGSPSFLTKPLSISSSQKSVFLLPQRTANETVQQSVNIRSSDEEASSSSPTVLQIMNIKQTTPCSSPAPPNLQLTSGLKLRLPSSKGMLDKNLAAATPSSKPTSLMLQTSVAMETCSKQTSQMNEFQLLRKQSVAVEKPVLTSTNPMLSNILFSPTGAHLAALANSTCNSQATETLLASTNFTARSMFLPPQNSCKRPMSVMALGLPTQSLAHNYNDDGDNNLNTTDVSPKHSLFQRSHSNSDQMKTERLRTRKIDKIINDIYNRVEEPVSKKPFISLSSTTAAVASNETIDPIVQHTADTQAWGNGLMNLGSQSDTQQAPKGHKKSKNRKISQIMNKKSVKFSDQINNKSSVTYENLSQGANNINVSGDELVDPRIVSFQHSHHIDKQLGDSKPKAASSSDTRKSSLATHPPQGQHVFFGVRPPSRHLVSFQPLSTDAFEKGADSEQMDMFSLVEKTDQSDETVRTSFKILSDKGYSKLSSARKEVLAYDHCPVENSYIESNIRSTSSELEDWSRRTEVGDIESDSSHSLQAPNSVLASSYKIAQEMSYGSSAKEHPEISQALNRSEVDQKKFDHNDKRETFLSNDLLNLQSTIFPGSFKESFTTLDREICDKKQENKQLRKKIAIMEQNQHKSGSDISHNVHFDMCLDRKLIPTEVIYLNEAECKKKLSLSGIVAMNSPPELCSRHTGAKVRDGGQSYQGCVTVDSERIYSEETYNLALETRSSQYCERQESPPEFGMKGKDPLLVSSSNLGRPSSQMEIDDFHTRQRYPSSEFRSTDSIMPLLDRNRNPSQRSMDYDILYDFNLRQRNPSTSSIKSNFLDSEMFNFDLNSRSRHPSYGLENFSRSRNPSGSSNRRSRPGSSSSDRELPMLDDFFSEIVRTRSRNSSGESLEPTVELMDHNTMQLYGHQGKH